MALLVGRRTASGATDSGAVEELQSFPFVAEASGVAQRICANFQTTQAVTSGELLIYADNGAQYPGALLGKAVFARATGNTGLFVATLPDGGVPIVKGVTYHLAWMPDQTYGTYTVQTGTALNTRFTTASGTTGANPFPAGASPGAGQPVIWAEQFDAPVPSYGPSWPNPTKRRSERRSMRRTAYAELIRSRAPLAWSRLNGADGVPDEVAPGSLTMLLWQQSGAELYQRGLLLSDPEDHSIFVNPGGYLFADGILGSSASEGSFEAWFTPTSWTAPVTLFQPDEMGMIVWSDGNTITVESRNGDFAQVSYSMLLGATYHVVFAADASSWGLYVNGELLALDVWFAGGPSYFSNTTYFVGDGGGAAQGLVDEPAIYGYVLGGFEALENYRAGIGYVEPPPSGGPGTFTASASDSAPGTDAATGSAPKTGTAADTAGATDAAGGVHAGLRAAADTAGGTDAAVGAKGRAAGAADSAPAADAAVGTHAVTRSIADAAPGADAAVGRHAVTRLVSDSAPAADTAAGQKSKVGVAADTAPASDSALGKHAGVRGAADSAPGSDAAKGVHVVQRGVGDSAPATDAATGAQGMRNGAAADSAGATDTAVGRHSVTRTAGDAANVADSAGALRAGARGASDAAPAVDAGRGVHVTVRAAADAAGVSDAAKGLHAGLRAAADAAAAGDVARRQVSVTKTAADVAGGADSAAGARQGVLNAFAADLAPAGDVVTRSVSVTRGASDAAPAGDQAGGKRSGVRGAADVAPASDGASSKSWRLVGVVDSAPANDVAAMARRWAVFATDVLPVPAEQALGEMGLRVSAVDVLPPVVDAAVAAWWRELPETEGRLSAVLVVELVAGEGVGTSAMLVVERAAVPGVTSATLVPS